MSGARVPLFASHHDAHLPSLHDCLNFHFYSIYSSLKLPHYYYVKNWLEKIDISLQV